MAANHGGRTLVFCASLADIFEDWPGQMTDSQERPLFFSAIHPGNNMIAPVAPDGRPYTLDDARARLFALIRETPHLTWQLLTKRPENIIKMMPAGEWKNVWLGVSVENQEYMHRIDQLTDAREVVRCPVGFVSAEPLLGPLDFGTALSAGSVQWVIIGGESGGGARSMHIEWARRIVGECMASEVPVFVKQLGKAPTRWGDEFQARFKLPMSDPKGGDITEFPRELQVREFP
jgi:hypothetical protein